MYNILNYEAEWNNLKRVYRQVRKEDPAQSNIEQMKEEGPTKTEGTTEEVCWRPVEDRNEFQ